MRTLERRLAALEAQQRPEPLVVAVGETDDPMNANATYRNIRTYVIDPREPFDYDRAIRMIVPEESE